MVNHICVYEMPVANFDYEPTNPDMINSEVQFNNYSTGGMYFDWTFGDGNSSSDFNPSNTYPEIGNETYAVQLTVSTDYGCVDIANDYVTIDEVIQLYVPNAVTINSDGFNEKFTPVFMTGFEPLGYNLQIFNRWGTLIFESQDYNIGWDGTYQGVIVQEGTYIWKIEFRENQTDITHREFGHVTVLK